MLNTSWICFYVRNVVLQPKNRLLCLPLMLLMLITELHQEMGQQNPPEYLALKLWSLIHLPSVMNLTNVFLMGEASSSSGKLENVELISF